MRRRRRHCGPKIVKLFLFCDESGCPAQPDFLVFLLLARSLLAGLDWIYLIVVIIIVIKVAVIICFAVELFLSFFSRTTITSGSLVVVASSRVLCKAGIRRIIASWVAEKICNGGGVILILVNNCILDGLIGQGIVFLDQLLLDVLEFVAFPPTVRP